MRTPVAYKARRRASRETLARGMNFAVGGAGVLDTGNFQRNISAQIDLFQTMHHSPGCRAGSGKRTALVVVSGNDYAYAADKDNGTSVRGDRVHPDGGAGARGAAPAAARRGGDAEGGGDQPAPHGLHADIHPPAQLHRLRPAGQRRRRPAQRRAPVRPRRPRPQQPHLPPPRRPHPLRRLPPQRRQQW
uniref:Uncharacterized protein n=1 Tax=Aegilops tauschii subsp. strangulata TaxID=200361 RepID=A0A453GYS1_AEGTS